MASPFRYFRKHQKVFIAAAAVLCMFVFVLSDWLMSLVRNAADGGGGQRSPTTVVASWEGGKLNERELAIYRSRRFFLSQFLRQLQITGIQKISADGGQPTPPNIPNFIFPEDISPQAVDLDVVRTHVLADLATRADISVSDEVINHYLREAGFGRISGDELATMLKGYRVADRQATVDVLFASLRDNLLATTYQSSTEYASQLILPEQRWEDWRRVNDQISLEAALLPADQFLADVLEPTDEQISAFYNTNKDQEPERLQNVLGAFLPVAGTGFTRPRRVRLQYLFGDVIQRSEKLLDTVTDAEIEDYYESNKRTQFVRADSTALDSAASSSTEDSSSGETAVDDIAADDSSIDASSIDASSIDASSIDGPEEGDTSSEEKTKPAAEDSQQYQPLEDVRDQIRLHLANQKGVVQLQETFQQLNAQLRKVYNPYGEKLALAAAEKKPLPDPPEILADLSGVAEKHGLIFEKTPLLSILKMARDSLIGKAVDARTGRMNVTQLMFGKLDLYDPALAQDIDGNWYLALKIEDLPRSVPPLDDIRDEVVKAWKYEEATKLALEKAKSLASECQEEGTTIGEFLAEKTGDDSGDFEVVTTDLFSFLSFNVAQTNPQQGPRLSEAPPLTAVGPDLMTAAFQLKEGEVQGVWNHDHSSAYMIRLHSRLRSEEELHKLFLQEANTWPGARSATMGRWQQFQGEVFDRQAERVGLELKGNWGGAGAAE
jgi:hypothetical protein